MNRDVACGQDIGYRGGEGCFESGAESWRQHVGVGRIVCVCVCFMCLYCLSSSCVLCTQCYQSIQSPEVSTSLLGIKLFIINNQHFSKFFLFFSLIFETSSNCIPFLICTSVFSQAPGSKIFFLY